MPESTKIIYFLKGLSKQYGQRKVLDNITLSFYEGAKIGVIGANGAGKSTLLRIMAGEEQSFDGEAKGIAGITVGYLPQEPKLTEDRDVLGNLEEAVAPIRKLLRDYDAVNEELGAVGDDAEMNRLLEKQAVLQHEIDHKDAWNLHSHLEQAATALDLPPLDADVKTLSGGERRRVALAKLLMSQPDLLLLDEPTNHLDAATVEWLEQHLKEYPGTVILITHDRYFLDNVVGWMLEIERGKGIPYQGNYSTYLAEKQKRLDVKRGQNEAREKLIARELEWISKTPKARTTRSKSRLARYKELVEQRADEALDTLELRIPPGPRLGDKVIRFEDVSKGFGDRVLIKDLSFELPPGGILGVVGPNGAGKSTLLRMIMGQEQPDRGKVTIGSTVLLRYLDQSRTVLDDSKSVFDNITEGNAFIPYGGRTLQAREYVARFNFKGEDQQKPLGECSGGMRNRVLLAKMLREPANVILLDEPTNDLDLETLRVLEEAVQEYVGSAIVVSHDRYFLNRVATHILSFEVDWGEGVVIFHHGDWETYSEWRAKERGRRGIGPESRAGRYRQLLRES
jgi:ATP-binding cassette ChvD family protein